MLVRALCRQQDVPMIQITPSLLLRKYVGETSQMTKAIFTLARKLQPCVMFVDEMDSLLRARTNDDTSVDRNIKTECEKDVFFIPSALILSFHCSHAAVGRVGKEWLQGGGGGLHQQVSSIYSSFCHRHHYYSLIPSLNRPQDLDAAIQRRFERSFLLGLPDLTARADIFRRTLTGCSLLPSLKEFDFRHCAVLTEGYSSSDLRALCKAALQLCETSETPSDGEGLRPLTIKVSDLS